MPMDDVEGLSFGYQFPEDVTAAVRRAFRKEATSGSLTGNSDGLGPFVYHAEGLTFAFIEHGGSEGGKMRCNSVGVPVAVQSRNKSACWNGN